MQYKLGEIFNLQMGKTPSRRNADFWTAGTHDWISIADISASDVYINATKERITQAAVSDSGIKVIPAKCVIMSFKLSIGKVAITTKPMYSNEAIVAFISKNKLAILPEYLYYRLRSIKWDINSNKAVKGSTLNKSSLENLSISFPPLAKQKQIVLQLDKISFVISTLKMQLNKLDELVKARFVEMFGDDESVLLSDVKIQDVADVRVGVVIKPTQYYTDKPGIKAFRSINIGPGFIRNSDWVFFSEEAMDQAQRSIAREGDVLVVRTGYPGTCCVVSAEYDGCNVVDLIIVRPNRSLIEPDYLALFTNLPHGKKQILSTQRGIAQKHFNVEMYKNMRIILPDLGKQRELVDFIKQVDKSKVVGLSIRTLLGLIQLKHLDFFR